MTSPAQRIADTVPSFLRKRRDHIVRAWEALVIAEERRVELSGLALRDGIHAFLDELADWLESDPPPVGKRLGGRSFAHALHRLDEGLDLRQVMREHRLLRESILRCVLEGELLEQDRAGPREQAGREARVLELARLNAGLDVALSDAIERFVGERDRRVTHARDQVEQVLRESDRRKGEFLGVLSHELRNPLAAITNGVVLLESAHVPDGSAAHAIEVISRQARVLVRLVNDLLDVARISRGKIQLQRARVDLCEVARGTADDLACIFDEAGVTLRCAPAPAPVWADVDPVRVGQILGNLLRNAARFTPAGGRVGCSVTARDGRVVLSVQDTGIGLDPAQVGRIFEPFVQGDGSLAREGGGLGLGLALVKELARLHGGAVEARSEGPGRGSEFLVTLPLAPA